MNEKMNQLYGIMCMCIAMIYGPTQFFYIDGISLDEHDNYNDIIL